MSSSLPAILVVGATGNTGEGVVRRLSELLSNPAAASAPSVSSSQYRIIALTRDAKGEVAQSLSQLPHVSVEEADWQTLEADWLQSRCVQRVYLAPHNLPSQFVDESGFLRCCLLARVRYLVKLSTLPAYCAPDSDVYYGRSHFAIEQMLQQPPYASGLPSTCMRANYFMPSILGSTLHWMREHGSGASQQQQPAPCLMDAQAPVALVHSLDIGAACAALLALSDPSAHHGRVYTISGPRDVTGREVMQAVQKAAGANGGQDMAVHYRDTAGFMKTMEKYPASVHKSREGGLQRLWTGQASMVNARTSDEVLKLAPPQWTVERYIEHELSQEKAHETQ